MFAGAKRPVMGDRPSLARRGGDGGFLRFSADSGYFDPVIPAQAGIQDSEDRR
jgi:hypothetical protein